MKTRNSKDKDLINKGIMLGLQFSTVLFKDYFKPEFHRRLNLEGPLKALLLMVIADLLVKGDKERMVELFDFMAGTHLSLRDKAGSELIEDCIREIERFT